VDLALSKPRITGFLHHAYPLSIVGNYNDYLPWFYSNYVQLICNTDYFEGINDHLIDFYFPNDPLFSFPCMECFAVKPEFFDNKIDIVPFMINSINKKCYVYTHVDEFFIPNRSAYNYKHFTHNILVYGYEKNNFKVLGFDQNSNFTHTEVGFKEFSLGYENANYQLTILYNYNDYIKPKFDINNLVRSLNDYKFSINSINGNGFLPENPVFGLNIYMQLDFYLRNVRESQQKIDIRPFHILWEHKKTMFDRIEYLDDDFIINKEELLKKSRDLVDLSIGCRNTALKYIFTNNSKTITDLLSSIDDLFYKENIFLDELLVNLHK